MLSSISKTPKQTAHRPTTPGFTLVELLIVIVIIAVLATISIVAYNGIQSRATTSRIATTVDATAKLLEMYKIDHGSYPESDSKYYCIGSTNDYPAEAPFAEGACNHNTYGLAQINQDFNGALLQYTSTMPDGSLPPTVVNDGYSERGLIYFYNQYSNEAYLTYRVAGEADCVRGEKLNWYADMTVCEVTLTE